jgi:hypothetical protein
VNSCCVAPRICGIKRFAPKIGYDIAVDPRPIYDVHLGRYIGSAGIQGVDISTRVARASQLPRLICLKNAQGVKKELRGMTTSSGTLIAEVLRYAFGKGAV